MYIQHKNLSLSEIFVYITLTLPLLFQIGSLLKIIQNNIRMQSKPQQDLEYSKKRQQYTIELRKRNREQIINKKRQTGTQHQCSLQLSNKYLQLQNLPLTAEYIQFNIRQPSVSQLSFLVQCIHSQQIGKVLYGAIGLRKLMCNDQLPIQQVIDLGAISRLVELLKLQENPYLQLEAAWTLTNISSGTSGQCQCVVDRGALPAFVELLKSPYSVLIEQAVWGIANLAGDNIKNRNELIDFDVLQLLLSSVKRKDEEYLTKKAVWAICNLCRGKPYVKFTIVEEAMELLCKIIRQTSIQESNIQVHTLCCMGINNHCRASRQHKTHQKLDFFASHKIINRLVSYLSQSSDQLILASLKILGNFTLGNDHHIQLLLNQNIIIMLQMLLSNPRASIRKNVCWVLRNIAAGNNQQIISIIHNELLVNKLLSLIQTDSDTVKSDIIALFGNITYNGMSQDVIEWIIDKSIVRGIVHVLETATEVKLLEEALNTLDLFLYLGLQNCENKKDNRMCLELNCFYGVDTLERLQQHDSDVIFKQVSAILSKYFEVCEASF